MTGMTPELWFSMCLIGAPCSRMLESSSATPPPRLDSCSAELMHARDRLHVVLDAQQEAVVHDRATNRVRVRALDVKVEHLLRNFLRMRNFADSVHVTPVHDLIGLARRPLVSHVVVQVLADVEDEVLVSAGQPGHEHLSRDVAGLVGVLADSRHDADSAQEELHLVDELRVHQVEHHPAGGRAPVPPEQPGQQATLEIPHWLSAPRGASASGGIPCRPSTGRAKPRPCCCTPCEPIGPTHFD